MQRSCLLTNRVVNRLKLLATKYRELAEPFFPEVGGWKKLDDDKIWKQVVSQVAVVGSAAAGERLAESTQAQEQIRYEALRRATTVKRAAVINRTLRQLGVRYASADASKCRKTAALVRNFDFLASYPGGPRGYLRSLSLLSDDDSRVTRVADDLSYIKLKGARDLLAEQGLVTDVLALDTRLINILLDLGVDVPKDLRSNYQSYVGLQGELLEKVCVPIDITGVMLDRILFRNYLAIRKDIQNRDARQDWHGQRTKAADRLDIFESQMEAIMERLDRIEQKLNRLLDCSETRS